MGSTSYITTRNGSISQHVEYIAFNSSFYCFFGIVESHKIDLGRFCSRSILARFRRRTCLTERNSTEKRICYYGARYLDMKTSLWLSLDKEGENDLSVGGYVYSFNNPINFTDPDGNWPDLPSWKEIKTSYNNAVKSASKEITYQKYKMKSDWANIKRTVYNGKGWDDTVKDIKKTGRNIQKWTKDHKEQLIGVAKRIQKIGDDATTAGLIGAAAGAPIAGVGAAPGLAVATFGGYISFAGSVMEIGVKFIADDEEAVGDAGTFVAGELASFAINKVLPVPKGEIKKEVKEAIKATRDIIQNETSNKTKEIINEERK